MCFSASASFTASALLVPAGLYGIVKAKRCDPKFIPIASLPIIFGVQQIFEGLVWLGLGINGHSMVRISSLGFLFVSHFLWLFGIPLSAQILESRLNRKRFFSIIAMLGILYGAALYLPLLFDKDWLRIELVDNSIAYYTQSIYTVYGGPVYGSLFLQGLYTAIILVPLILSSCKSIKRLGWLIATSLIIAKSIVSGYAVISVWCFFAGLISLYVTYVVYCLPQNSLQLASAPRK